MLPVAYWSVTACGLLLLLQCCMGLSIDGDHFKRMQKSKRCSYMKKYGMMTADCFDRDLNSLPANLRSDIEILDASYNRIRELHKDTFTRYTSLRLLYLQDNMISFIEEGAFESLTSLEVIDLSLNSLHVVPDGLLKLPLRKLYINNNRLDETTGGGFADAPFSETLEFLSIAGCYLQELPPLLMYPNLKELNISGNSIKKISPEQIAPMCSLKLLDLRGNPSLFKISGTIDECECQMLSMWMKNKQISLANGPVLNCSKKGYEMKLDDFIHCGNMTEPVEAREKYEECTGFVRSQEEARETRKTWIIVGSTLLPCTIILIIILFWRHRRNRRRRKNESKKSKLGNNNNAKMSGLGEDEVMANNLLREDESQS